MSRWFRRRRLSLAAMADRPCRLGIEELESRTLLSAGTSLIQPALTILPAATANPLAQATPPAGALTPQQVRSAYQENLTFNGVSGDGQGQTIAIVDAYDDPNLAGDLNTFSQQFGLPTTSMIDPQTG